MSSKPSIKSDLSIVIPSWNSKSILDRSLESIREAWLNIAIQIIIIDNGSIDGTCEFLKEGFPQILIIPKRENPGFARAYNQGSRIAEGSNILPLNNDTLMKKGTLERLVAFMDENRRLGSRPRGCAIRMEASRVRSAWTT